MRFSPHLVRRVGVVGAGYFSQFHMQGWQSVPGVEIVAVCDASKGKANESAARYGVARAFDNVHELLDKAQVDLLDIVTPPSSHQSVIQNAMSRGIPAICQKPFSTHYQHALALTEMSELAKVPLIIHENFRFMPWYREIRRRIDAGLFGTLHSISFRLRPGDGQGADAYLSRQPYFQTLPRFLVMETAVHFIDTFRYLCGEVTAVYAHLRRLNSVIAGEDAGFIHFEFSSGVAGGFDGNRLNDHVADNPRRTMGEMWLEGERGVLRLDGNAHLYFKPHLKDEVEIKYDRGDDTQFGGGACATLQQHVVAGLLSGEPIENSARDYLRNLKIQEAVYASHARQCRIEIDEFHPPAVPVAPFV